ncbi:MAG: substrate-binding domain-containing protein [Actinomycetia bacterium]|nr:substrate-binding domain-containing protein [Actinomycetes bacterium]
MIRATRLTSFGTALGLVAALAGCGGGAAPGSAKTASSPHYVFELITKSNASPYWLAVKDGADAAAKKVGATVHFEAPASGTDLATQISMVNNAAASHVDGIILAAQNPSALVAPVQAAEKDGIPVVTVDSGISPNIADSFLATSNVASSAALAKYVAKLAGNHGAYAIIDFNEESSTGIARPKGFRQGMSAIPGMSYVGMQIGNNSIPLSTQEALTLLESHPEINVMFGANDRSALGVAAAVQQLHKVGKVVVAGFDADLGEVDLIKSGVIAASVLQSPYDMGYQAVMELVKIKHHEAVPKRVDTPYMIVTPQNVNTPAAVRFIKQYIPNYQG